jgi:hypothetical protein
VTSERSGAIDTPPEDGRWVGMRRACEILGVNESTLRQWSDAGRVPVFLTPGGHRRYREADLLSLTRPVPAAADGAVLSSALLASHERYESVARRAFHSSAWFAQLDDVGRRRFRVLGNSMLGLLSSYAVATSRRERERSLRSGREVATEYGELAASLGLSLAQATEAFILFRAPVLEAVHRWVRDQRDSAAQAGDSLKRVNQFMDQVLLAMATAHERGTGVPWTGESP